MEQLILYQNLTWFLYQADENQIFELTSCLSTCDKYEYAVQPENNMHKIKYNQSHMGEPNAMGLRFYFLTAKHEVKEQVISWNLMSPQSILNEQVIRVSST